MRTASFQSSLWFCLLPFLSAALFVGSGTAAPPLAVGDPLPVILKGSGNWLDRSNAMQQVCAVLPAEGQALLLTNVWMNGQKILMVENEYCSGVLLLSNVWVYGSAVSEDAFWHQQGLTNEPMEVYVPGGSGYYLLVANTRVLPFIARKGTMAPAAIWSLPNLPVLLKRTKGRSANISQCGVVSFEGDALSLSGRLGGLGVRQTWQLRVQGGLLRLQLQVLVEPDY